MKRKSFFTSLATTALALMLTVSGSIDAFNYNITFTGSNASTSVTSVEVQNLTKGTTVTVPAGNTLNLYDVVSSFDQPSINDETIRVYPNPMQGKSTLTFFAPQAGNTQINVFGVDGRNITGIYSNLQEGKNQFQLSLAPGAYILKVNGNGYNYATRVISRQSNATDKPTISYIGNEKLTNSQAQKAKNGGAVISMLYSVGDQLLYKGTSGNYTTIVTDKPTESKSTNFYFVECKDADDNYYPVVIIGSQIWMAENLKTTSYRTGESVSNVTDATSWSNASFGAWCDNDNSTANGTKYGHLYNWFAASDSRNIAPIGWHVSVDNDLTTLVDFLGGENTAGSKLKETGNLNWFSNNGATNETGFSALPVVFRGFNGNFASDYYRTLCFWWSSTYSSTNNASYFGVGSGGLGLTRSETYKLSGFSIRCISDIVLMIPPTTREATLITGTTATSGGNITSNGGTSVIARGVCWSTSTSPTIALSTKTLNGSGTGMFTSAITGLTPNTTYYVRAYATNSGGTSYGTEISFQTATTPTLITTVASNIGRTTATGGGNVTLDGRATVTARGVCWSTNPNPTIYDNRTTDGTGTGVFTSSLTVLFSSTTYYVRAYATNSIGTSYGNEQVLTTNKATDIDGNLFSSVKIGTQTWMGENLKTTKYRTGESISKPTTATNWSNATYGAWCDYNSDAANGIKYGHLYNWYAVVDTRNIAPMGWHVPTNEEWSTLQNYLIMNGFNYDETITENKIAKSLASPNGWAFSNVIGAVGTNDFIEKINTTNFSGLPAGFRRSDNGIFQNLSALTHWWSKSDTGFGNLTSFTVGLLVSNSDLYREYAYNSTGYSVRCVRDELPTITTSDVHSITGYKATAGGNITSDGGATVTARGLCWSTSPAPTIYDDKTYDGVGNGNFTSSVTNLTPNTTYFIRSYTSNRVGTAYGVEISFKTLDATMSTIDIDNNAYTSVVIGTQTWMVENLKTSHYRNGESIDNVIDDGTWANLFTGAWCNYNNNAENGLKYGKLYNWYAIDDIRNIAPYGWHVASEAEWTILINFMGGESIAGGKLKEAGTIYWNSPNLGATNEFGFSALPGGNRGNGNGSFFLLPKYGGSWWCSTPRDDTYSFSLWMGFSRTDIGKTAYSKNEGFSVRCIKD